MTSTRQQPDLTTPGPALTEWLHARADELESLVAPFRATRRQGHRPLRALLDDPATRPALVGQLAQLSGFLNWLHPHYLQAHAAACAWVRQYDQPAADQPALLAVYDPQATAQLLDALQLLNNEVVADLLHFARWAPEAFQPSTAARRL